MGFFMKKRTLNEGVIGGRLRVLALMAILAAMSMVLGKLLQISIGNSIRISFENLPLIFAGFLFGPIGGGVVALVEDTVGSLIAFGEINPIVTAGAVTIGGLSGALSRLFFRGDLRRVSIVGCAVSVVIPHIVGSMVIKSVGLYVFYHTAVPVLLVRVPVYLVISAAESIIIWTLLQSNAVKSSLRPFIPSKNKD